MTVLIVIASSSRQYAIDDLEWDSADIAPVFSGKKLVEHPLPMFKPLPRIGPSFEFSQASQKVRHGSSFLIPPALRVHILKRAGAWVVVKFDHYRGLPRYLLFM